MTHLSESEISDLVLEFCRARSAQTGRVVGMRQLHDGDGVMVRYLDTWSSSRLDEEEGDGFNPAVVLYHGSTWFDVLAQICIDRVLAQTGKRFD